MIAQFTLTIMLDKNRIATKTSSTPKFNQNFIFK